MRFFTKTAIERSFRKNFPPYFDNNNSHDYTISIRESIVFHSFCSSPCAHDVCFRERPMILLKQHMANNTRVTQRGWMTGEE